MSPIVPPRRAGAAGRPRRAVARAAASAWLLAACSVVVDPRAEYDRTAGEIRAATGVAEVHHPDAAGAAVEAHVAALLRDGLSADEAVEAGLLGNPDLQADFREVGAGKALAVQAGLLANPVLSAALRLPSGGGRALLEAGLLGSLVDAWERPLRQASADAELERRILDVAARAVALAADIRAAHADALALARVAEAAEHDRVLAEQSAQLAGARLAARAGTAIDDHLARLALLESDVAVQDARLAAEEARRRLVQRLGFAAEPPALQLVDAPPDPARPLPPLPALQQLAWEGRLDVRAARARLDAAAAELRREEDVDVRVLDVGVDAERDDAWSAGPAVELELPVFDRGEARVALALETLAGHERRLQAVRIAARHEVTSARARTLAATEAWRLQEEQVVPQAEALLDLAQQAFGEGASGLLPVIEARRALLAARTALALRRRDAAAALADLEQAVGVPREQLFAAAGEASAGTPVETEDE